MIPTVKLRFVERCTHKEIEFEGKLGMETRTRTVLQQWWEDRNKVLCVQIFDNDGIPVKQYAGEWRDVPLEVEE